MLALVLVLSQVATAVPGAGLPGKKPTPLPTAAIVRADTTPKVMGAGAAPTGIGSIGSRVKLNREKAATLFRQDVVPTPGPSPTPGPTRTGPVKDAFSEMVAESHAQERSWRERELDRRTRLAAARENQRDVCARYHAAAAAAGIHDGYTSDAAGAVLGALLADCNTATRKADAVEAEAATLAEECRKTRGCQPGWLR